MKTINRPLCIVMLALLTINFSCTKRNHFDDTVPEMKIPFIALNTALKSRVRITDDKEYLNELEKTLGISGKQIKELFDYLKINPSIDVIKTKAGAELNSSLKEFRDLQESQRIDFFMINILTPYLTLVVNNAYVNVNDGEDIHALFAEIFDTGKEEINPLAQLVRSSNDFHEGNVFKTRYTYELNDYLKGKGFYLEYGMRNKVANIYKIEYDICKDNEWRPDKKISIRVLKRIYPHFMVSKLGYAPAEHSEVFIFRDLIYHYAEDYKNELSKKMPRVPYSNNSKEELWKALALDIDLIRANRIRWELAYKDLNGKSLSQIEKGQIIHTALHEAKHRIDEIDMPDMRLNLDLEVSAYLTTAIFGVFPSLGLRETIEWTEAYYHSTKYTKLRYLLGELWGIADKSLKENFSDERLRAELRKIYENYRTIRGDVHYIDLDEFERRMVPIVVS